MKKKIKRPLTQALIIASSFVVAEEIGFLLDRPANMGWSGEVLVLSTAFVVGFSSVYFMLRMFRGRKSRGDDFD
jgi:hypothetical protein